MARLILKSPYLKSGGDGAVSGYMNYIATRENVQLVPDGRPATRKQEQLIANLVKDFPDTKELFEYGDYASKPTKANASAFITLALELNWDAVNKTEVYMKYIATRPRVERIGSHGLFGDADNVDLDKAMSELDAYTGNVWTHIISLRREDAARLGYDNAGAWRDLIRANRNDIAAAMKIPPNDFRWYAAFHDEGKHPHVHMMAWSAKPGQAYLSADGIRQIKSKLTNDIFKQEMLHVYEQKSESRDELVQEARQAMLELTREMRQGLCDHPKAEELIMELSRKLETVKGKKSYGYRPKPAKALVDKIVDQMERLPVVAECYERWLELQGQVDGYYSDDKREKKKLSQQKEFRAIKNAVIREAERLRAGELTFEDADMRDEPEDDCRTSEFYQRMKQRIYDADQPLDERDYAVSQMRELAELGNPYAQYQMGKLYRDGGLIIPDWVEARKWFKPAAEKGLSAAQYALGKMLLSDDVEVRDPSGGLRWLEQAAKNGSHFAAYRLGKEYLRGEVTEKDTEKALACMNSSAERGNQYAQYMLGKLYLTGNEVEQNLDTAQHWLTQSASQGNTYAQFFLDRLSDARPPSVMLSTTRLLADIGAIFQNNSLPKTGAMTVHIDRKRLQQLMEKRQAQGIKGMPEPEEEQGMKMRGY